MKVGVTAEDAHFIGSLQQSGCLLNEFDTNPEGACPANIFGKPMDRLAKEGTLGKIFAMPDEIVEKAAKNRQSHNQRKQGWSAVYFVVNEKLRSRKRLTFSGSFVSICKVAHH